MLQCGADAGLGVGGGLDLGRAGFGALRHAGLFGIQLAQGLLLVGRLLLLAGAQLELLAPAAQSLAQQGMGGMLGAEDRKSTRLNSSHSQISYAVFCLKKKKQKNQTYTVAMRR